MKKVFVFLCMIMLLLAWGCRQPADIEAEKAEIMKMLAESDQELLDGVIAPDSTDDGTAINIKQGNIEKLTAAEVAERNAGLLARGRFVKIENIEGPFIGVSPDGSMAWMAVKTRFTIAYTDSLGEQKEWQGTEARLEVYEKKNGKWDNVATAQTF